MNHFINLIKNQTCIEDLKEIKESIKNIKINYSVLTPEQKKEYLKEISRFLVINTRFRDDLDDIVLIQKNLRRK